jgi:PAS domain S-box-containing protein
VAVTSTSDDEDGEVRALCRAVDDLGNDAILGYEELLPHGGFEAFLARVTPDDRDAVARQMQRAIETRGPWAVECRITRRDSALRWILVTGSPLRGAKGERRGMAGIVQDITDRKRSEEELRAGGARRALLERLGDTLHGLSDALEVQAAAAGLLREHLGASRVHYAEVESDGKHAVVAHDHAVAAPDRARRYALADFPCLADELRAGRTLVVTDASADSRIGPEERATYLSLPVAALVVVPILKQGRLAALLSVHRSTARAWSREEVRLIEQTAARTCDAVLRARAEKAVRAGQERFREALDHMSDGYAILSPDWTYLFVNKANAVHAHSTPEDMVGRSMFEVVPGFETSPIFEAFRRCMEERTPQRVECPYTFEDGSSTWFEAVAEPLAEGILVRAVDVTARKRDELALRDSEELVRTIAENSTQALVMMDAAGYCTYWNPALLAMTGYTAEELRSRPLHDLVHHHHPDGRPYPVADCPIDRALLENFDVRAHEDVFFRKDGSAFPVLCAASPIVKGGKSVATVIEVRDVTERKRAEEALLEAGRRKDHFLAVLSHELRNPLAPIKNGLYILDRALAGSEQARRAREVIERQVDQLTHLVDDLLDVTRIARGKVRLQRERLDLNELVRRTLDDHRSLFEEAELAVEAEPLPTQVFVDADWNRIAQSVGNLLLNAAKFTPPGGRVTVALAVDDSARQAVLRVSDTGAGIAPELLPRLFEPFVQADATLDRTKGGLGLGLAVVKGLVEQHGGSVVARSDGTGRGAEFTMRLPLDVARSSLRDVAVAGVRTVQRRVLIIEDNRDAADTLQEVLELDGHEVAVAHSGPEGIVAARQFHPDLVFCDIGLPGMEGYEVARVFRADKELQHAHLVALSGYALPEDLRRAAEAGFDRHIAKPPTIAKIWDAVRVVVGRSNSTPR